MGYSRRTSNYPKKLTLFDSTHMMSMNDHAVVNMEILWIDSGCSLEKEFTKLIRMNP